MRAAIVAFAPLILLLSGCAVIDATATVAGAAVSVTATTVEVGAKAVGAAADAATDSDEEEAARHQAELDANEAEGGAEVDASEPQ
jgi:hypothetical protein